MEPEHIIDETVTIAESEREIKQAKLIIISGLLCILIFFLLISTNVLHINNQQIILFSMIFLIITVVSSIRYSNAYMRKLGTQWVIVEDESITIEHADVNDVFNKSIEWLDGEESYIENVVKPFNIHAIHRGISAIERDKIAGWKKRIVITLAQSGDSVDISTKIFGVKNLLLNSTIQRDRHWSKIVEEYYDYIGVDIDESVLKNLYTKTDLKLLWKDHLHLTFQYLFLVFFFIALIFLNARYGSGIGSAFTGAHVILGFSVLALLEFFIALRFRKRRKELYNENKL